MREVEERPELPVDSTQESETQLVREALMDELHVDTLPTYYVSYSEPLMLQQQNMAQDIVLTQEDLLTAKESRTHREIIRETRRIETITVERIIEDAEAANVRTATEESKTATESRSGTVRESHTIETHVREEVMNEEPHPVSGNLITARELKQREIIQPVSEDVDVDMSTARARSPFEEMSTAKASRVTEEMSTARTRSPFEMYTARSRSPSTARTSSLSTARIRSPFEDMSTARATRLTEEMSTARARSPYEDLSTARA
ncbi:unnamed protein product, partial [Cylicostephanus goldi]